MFFYLTKKTTFKDFILEDYSHDFSYDIKIKDKIIEFVFKFKNSRFDQSNSYDNDRVYLTFYVTLYKTDIDGFYVFKYFIPSLDIKYYQKIFNVVEDFIEEHNIKGISITFSPKNISPFVDIFSKNGYFKIKYGDNIIFSKNEKYLNFIYNTFFGSKNNEKGNYELNVAKKILKDCKSYLQEINYRVEDLKLYRGMGGSKKIFIKKKTRLEDRKPKDTPEEYHNKANLIMKKIFGYPFRNGLFVTGRKRQALEYSKEYFMHKYLYLHNTYTIFPIGDFQYLWSNEIRDFYNLVKNYDFNDLEKIIKSKYYFNEKLDEAIKSGNEIMIWTNDYYAVMSDTEFENRVLNYIEKYGREKG